MTARLALLLVFVVLVDVGSALFGSSRTRPATKKDYHDAAQKMLHNGNQVRNLGAQFAKKVIENAGEVLQGDVTKNFNFKFIVRLEAPVNYKVTVKLDKVNDLYMSQLESTAQGDEFVSAFKTAFDNFLRGYTL